MSLKLAYLLALGLALGPVAWSHPGLDVQISDIEVRIADHPRDPTLYLRRGELHRLHREFEAAESDFRRARKLDPGLAAVDLALARLHLDLGRPKQARKALDRHLRRHPDYGESYILRGRTQSALGRYLDAAADYDRGIDLLTSRGPRPEHYLERARALESAGPDHLGRAIAGLDQGLAVLGPAITLQSLAIDLEVRAGDFPAALERLDRLARDAERKESWLLRKAQILETAGQPEEASAAYTAALEAVGFLPSSRRHTRAVERLVRTAAAAVERLNDGER